MRALLLGVLLAGTLLPLPGTASACGLQPYPDCEVHAGPASAGAWVDTRWWPLEGQFYHCVDTGDEQLERILCQHYRLA